MRGDERGRQPQDADDGQADGAGDDATARPQPPAGGEDRAQVGSVGRGRLRGHDAGEVVVGDVHRCSWVVVVAAWAERSRARARDAVLFTVPTETPSSRATSCSEVSR